MFCRVIGYADCPMNLFFPDVAWAMAPSPGGGVGGSQLMPTLIMFGAMFAIFYFLMIRPQQKQRSERDRMLSAIKRGDKVVTTSGMFGTVTNLTDKTVANQTDRAAEDFAAALERRGIAHRRVARDGLAAFVVELASPQSWNDAITVANEFQTFERSNDDQAAGRFRMAMSARVQR